MAAESWMLNDAIEVLGWTLLHFVWQGTVVGVLAATLLLALRRRSANARYLTAVSALGLMFLLPLGTIAWIERTPPPGEVSPIVMTTSTIEMPRARNDGTPALDEPPINVERIGIDFENPPPADAVPLVPVSETGQTLLDDLFEKRSAVQVDSFVKPFMPWSVGVWLIGVGVLSLRLFAGWLSVQHLRRRATQPASENWQALLRRIAERLRVTRPVKLVESVLVEVPTVIGWLSPVILLPASAMTGLTTEQLEALLAHELAHVRRHDYLINLLQTVVETLLFYHPAVWWVSHRIRLEREHCCDDLAVQVCGDGLTYAKALVALEELRAPKLGLAMSSHGGSLLTRVARLLGQAEQQRRPTGWFAGLLSLVLLTMAGALGAGLLTPQDKPTEGLSIDSPTTATKSADTSEETFSPTQRQGQETRAERELVKQNRFVGRVRLKTEKALPDLEKVELPPGKILDESLVFSKDGGLANVFVYLRKPTFKIEEPADAAEPKPFFLIAEDGKFWPHAAVVRVGRPIVFENRHTEAANLRLIGMRNGSMNVTVLRQDRFKVSPFAKAETLPISVKSDFQPWMQSHLLMLDHPFADVTDDEGRFTINGLPPGQHEFRVWHERVGWLEKSLVVTIKPGEESRSDLEYEPNRLKLEEAEVQNWSNRQIDTRRVPQPFVPRRAAPQPEVKPKDAEATLGVGLPTPPLQPTAGLPNNVQPSTPRTNDSQKTETSGPAERRGQETRAERSAAVAKAEYEKILEANRRVPGSIPDTEVERAKLNYEKALLVEVRLAVERGIAFLKAQQQESGVWLGTPADGVTALCAAALWQAGVKTDDPVMQRALAHLRKVEQSLSYTVALQTMVFCWASPKEDAELILRNVEWLEKAQVTEGEMRGAWSYAVTNLGVGDSSCSRFAVMGLHAAKQAGFEVKAETWRHVSDYWLTTQKDQGLWGYTPQSAPTPTMTLAGIACLATANRYLPQDEQTKTREAAMRKPAEYLEKVIPDLSKAGFALYALQSLERAGHISGFKEFGKLDWQADLTKRLLETQHHNGFWKGTTESELVATSFALLALTGQPEPKLVGYRLRFAPRDADKPVQMLSDLINSSTPPMQRTVLSGGVRIEFLNSDGLKCRIEADRAIIESDARVHFELEMNPGSDVMRIECIGSVKCEDRRGVESTQLTADRLWFDVRRNLIRIDKVGNLP